MGISKKQATHQQRHTGAPDGVNQVLAALLVLVLVLGLGQGDEEAVVVPVEVEAVGLS
jgi:hypothetical protein